MTRRLRIFLSSPGDCASTREVAAQTIEKLAQDYARHFDGIEPYLWEHEAMLASGHFQDSIEPPSRFDIVVLILWSRLGTPMPERTELREYRGVDGRVPVTGTEWEYEEALRKTREGGAPDLLVFRNLQPAQIDVRDQRHRDEQLRQLSALDAFWGRHFANQGMFLGAYTEFADNVEFSHELEAQLRKLIEKRIAELAPGGLPEGRTWTHAPFRGLEAYDFEHAPIFFGQDQAVGKAMLQLASAAQAQSSFLLVLGASGSGKSSLVNAGLVPKLFVPRRVSGTAFLRRVVFRPSDAGEGEDLFDALARKLTTRSDERVGLAELISDEVGVADLASHLRGAAAAPELPFRLALGALSTAARLDGRMLAYESAKLVLVIDQLEELFANERITTPERLRFLDLLAGLVRSGLVWVIATMRADFWHRALEAPELARLSDGAGRLVLMPPSPAQIGQMIRRPAEAAGLSFEVHVASGLPLNEVIAEDLARDPTALPLLSYLLDQLYRADILEAGGAVLTYATYERLGRLDGAVAAKAEAALARCAAEDRDALGRVLFALVQMSATDGDVERAIARRVPLATFRPGSAERRLVDVLLDPDARLLVSDADSEGAATVRVAHEALIMHWDRARDFVLNNAAALKIRRRVEERFALWQAASKGNAETVPTGAARPRNLDRLIPWSREAKREAGLLTDIDLSDGRRLLAEHRAELDANLASYIERSAAEDQRAQTGALRVRIAAAFAAILLVSIASIAWVFGAAKSHEAETASAARLTIYAYDHLRSGDLLTAEGVALELLERPMWMRTANASATVDLFQRARAQDAQLAVLSGHTEMVMTVAYSPDGRRIVSSSYDKTARVWDAATGVQLMQLSGATDVVSSAAFSPDGRLIATACWDSKLRIWDSSTGALLRVISGSNGKINSVAFSPDGRRIVTASADKTAQVWDTDAGSELALLKGHGDIVESAVFSPNGKQILTASDDHSARIWDASSGVQIRRLIGHEQGVVTASYSPDGKRIVTSSADRTARIWDAATGAELTRLTGHTEVVTSAAFSPDGQHVATSSSDETVRIWDATSGAQVEVLSGSGTPLNDAAYSPDGDRVVTGSFNDGTVRIWNATGGAQISVLSNHGAAVYSATYSPDGRRIIAGSQEKTAVVWDAATGAPLPSFAPQASYITAARYSLDGRRIVTASDGGQVRVWDAATAAMQLDLVGHSGAVSSVGFSPDGAHIVTASAAPEDPTARIWDAARGDQVRVIRANGGISSAEYSPDGLSLVTASMDGSARVWNAGTGALVRTLSSHSGAVLSATYSPDGRRIATASSDHTARIWDAATGAQLWVLFGAEDQVNAVAFSPDGRRLVSGSFDGAARIWDTDTGVQLALLEGHTGGVSAVAYSPDGARIITGSIDGTVRIWAGASYPDLQTQISWMRAAQINPLTNADRAGAGLPLVARPASGAKTDEPTRLARLGANEDQLAVSQASAQARNDHLLKAFSDYAAAVARAEREGWADADWRMWRYRRASIARLLAHDGMMRQVADAYDRAIAQ